MEIRSQYFLLTLCCLFVFQAQAQETTVYEADENRIYLEEADINAYDFEIGLYTGLLSIQDFGTNNVNGLRLAYHISESVFIEVNAMQSTIAETSFEKLTGISLGQGDDRDFSNYHLGIGYNLFQGESFFGANHAFNSSFYFTAGLGSSQFLSDSYHTVSWGFGYNVVFLDWLSVNLGAKDYLFRSDIFAEDDELFHSIELQTGINIIF